MSEVTSAGMRQTALLLHGMSAEDCAWLLEQLPQYQSASLKVLLDELHQLGIPCDVELLNQAITAPLAANAKTPDILPVGTQPGAYEHNIALLDNANAQSVFECLKSEPALLVGKLLKIKPWPWHNELLDQIGIVKRRQIVDFLNADTDVSQSRHFSSIENAAAVQAPSKFNETAVSLLLNQLSELKNHSPRINQEGEMTAAKAPSTLNVSEFLKKLVRKKSISPSPTRGHS